MNAFKYAVSAVMGAALLSAPAAAVDPNDDVKKAVEHLDAATKRLEAVEKGLNDYKNSNATAVRQVQDDVETLKAKVRQIEEDVKLLRQIATNPATTSKRDQFENGTKTGRLKLSNEYIEEMSVVVNGTSYRLFPGQSRTITVPAGPFTYQVLQLQSFPQERTIGPDEEKPIRIYTQRQ